MVGRRQQAICPKRFPRPPFQSPSSSSLPRKGPPQAGPSSMHFEVQFFDWERISWAVTRSTRFSKLLGSRPVSSLIFRTRFLTVLTWQ